jgi:hypothetical protein
MGKKFDQKALALGELHGISDLLHFKLGLIKSWISEKKSVAVLLERDFNQQATINYWMDRGHPETNFEQKFFNVSTSSFLIDQYTFLKELSEIFALNKDLISVHCVDVSFSGDLDIRSKEIIAVQDPDEFDMLREQYIVDRIVDCKPALDKADKILWICGNMHASKTPNYFSLDEEPTAHNSTSAMWLDSQYGLESIFSLPFSGQYMYQQNGKLEINNFSLKCSLFEGLGKFPFTGICASSSLPQLNDVFLKSYDWIYGISKTSPSQVRAR